MRDAGKRNRYWILVTLAIGCGGELGEGEFDFDEPGDEEASALEIPPPSTSGVSIYAAADATVRSGAYANTALGTRLNVQADLDEFGDVREGYIRFNLSGVSGSVTRARLQLFTVNGSVNSADVFAVSNTSWSESTITWNNRPPMDGAKVASLLATASAAWVEIDVTAQVQGRAAVSFGLRGRSTDNFAFASKEQTYNKPRLLVETTPPAGTCPSIRSMAAGGQFSCAVATDGKLWCWGLNDRSQLGISDHVTRPQPTRVGTESDWAQVSAGLHFACAVKTNGALYCWGYNDFDQLGQPTGAPLEIATPTRVGTAIDWARVETGTQYACALKTSGALFCWGRNIYGEVGTGAVAGSVRTPTEIAVGSRWRDISPGMFHSCGVRTDNSLWCWGRNSSGQLGLGDTVDRTVPTRVGTATWSDTDAGSTHSCGIQVGGTLWCWGYNNGYTIGQLDAVNRTSPTRVTVGPSVWTRISMAETRQCGTGADNSLWCWGSRDTVRKQQPTREGTGTDWTAITPSNALHTYGGFDAEHVCGIRAGSQAWCWGGNSRGQLGMGDGMARTVPERVSCQCFGGVCGTCGNGVCEAASGEMCTLCGVDCGDRTVECGNGECQSGETTLNCYADCGPNRGPAAPCGDGACTGGETTATCPADCGANRAAIVNDWNGFEAQVVQLINQRRASGVTCPSGPKPPVPAITVDSRLTRAAQLHAWDLAFSDYFGHPSCNGRTPRDRCVAAGMPFAINQSVSEIAGKGYNTPTDVVNGWVASDGHCVILMDARNRSLGAGFAKIQGRSYGSERWIVNFLWQL